MRCFYPGSVRLSKGVRRVLAPPGGSSDVPRPDVLVLLHCRVSMQSDGPAKSPESSRHPEGIFRADWTYCPASSADSDHLRLETRISNFRDALIDPPPIFISRYSVEWKKAYQKVQSSATKLDISFSFCLCLFVLPVSGAFGHLSSWRSLRQPTPDAA